MIFFVAGLGTVVVGNFEKPASPLVEFHIRDGYCAIFTQQTNANTWRCAKINNWILGFI